MRVDVFSTIHKGLRGALFGLAADLARVELSSTAAIDRVVCEVERVLGFLDDHARYEDEHTFALVRDVDPLLAEELERDHGSLEAVQREVEQLAQELAMSDLASRATAATTLSVAVHRLIALQLLHMNREETEASRVLWAAYDDAALVANTKRVAATIPPARLAEWRELVRAATSTPGAQEIDRQLVGGARLG